MTIKKQSINTVQFNIDQIQHILNDLINGKTLNGKKLNSEKLQEYKLSCIQAQNIINKYSS